MRNIILWISIFAGIFLILFGSMTDIGQSGKRSSINDEFTVAYVNGDPVSKKLYHSLQNVSDDVMDRVVLDRFLSEHILINKALEQGIVERDPKLREIVIEAMREFVITENQITRPDDVTLQAYYQNTIADYTPPARYQVQTQIVADDSVAPDDWFAGEPAARFLPLGILKRSIGEQAVENLAEMSVGDVVSYQQENGTLFVRLDGVRQSAAPAFDSVKRRVEEAWYRSEEEKLFDAYLKALLATSNVEYVEQ